VSLPAVAVCTGNNLVKLQLRVAVLSAIVLLGTLPIFIHFFDLRGAALSLLAAEATAGLAYVRLSASWLEGAGLKWPSKGFVIALTAVAFTLLACYVTAMAPALQVPATLALVAALGLAITAYFRSLPESTQAYLHAQVIQRFHLHRLLPRKTSNKSS
jgi:hypothetical protein